MSETYVEGETEKGLLDGGRPACFAQVLVHALCLNPVLPPMMGEVRGGVHSSLALSCPQVQLFGAQVVREASPAVVSELSETL